MWHRPTYPPTYPVFAPQPSASALNNTENRPPNIEYTAPYPVYSHAGAFQATQPPVLFAIPPGAQPFTFTWRPELQHATYNIPTTVPFTGFPHSDHAPAQRPRRGCCHGALAQGRGAAAAHNAPDVPPPQRPPSPATSVHSSVTYAPAPPVTTDSDTQPAAESTTAAPVVEESLTEARDANASADPSRARLHEDAVASNEQAPRTRTRKTYYNVELYKHKIYGLDKEYTAWYESHGDHARQAPPAPIRKLVERGRGLSRVGRLHVHRHERGVQVWMWAHAHSDGGVKSEHREWVAVEEGDAHPRLEGYVLHLIDNGEPRWVKPISAAGYAAGKGRRARVAAADE